MNIVNDKMSKPTPETKWYVTEYPEECDFAITDGNEIFATIIGGKTIGDQCDLASRIAKLPDLERERDEARQALKHIEEYGTEEINAAVELRQKLAFALVERDEVQKAVNGLCKNLGVSPANTTLLAVEVLRIQREREEAITRRMETIMQCELYEQERDKALVALASEIALADRLAHNLKIASHAWNNPTEHPAITDWKKARHE